ncbi:MAG TPA: hypothetical protein VJ021_00245 [Thermoplasmata archaeon]|nr:hypothetical protein [Thermoplasmata archaeon]
MNEDLLSVVALSVSIVALIFGLVALFFPLRQWYRDELSRWPFRVELHGQLKDVFFLPPTFCYRITNLSSKTAFFQAGYIWSEDRAPSLVSHVSEWPSRQQAGLFIEIPPNVWRNLHISLFNKEFGKLPEQWSLVFTEFYHSQMYQQYDWPSHLNRPIEEPSTEIPWGAAHESVEYLSTAPLKRPKPAEKAASS